MTSSASNDNSSNNSNSHDEKNSGACSGDIHGDGVSKRRKVTGQAVVQIMPESSRRHICAGQAIQDLASCVKELLENALDAGSQSINIRLFNKGLDIVEVSDDGCGIPQESRHLLATPHATSKSTTTTTLLGKGSSSKEAPSFGFRGEALHSLAALSTQLVIATRTANDEVAEQLEFDRTGTLLKSTPRPRKIGTTVAVLGLLSKTPVRRHDWEQRCTYHRQIVIQTVTRHALFASGIRIRLMDATRHGAETVVLATPGGSASVASASSNMMDAVSALWGAPMAQCLHKFDVQFPGIGSAHGLLLGVGGATGNSRARQKGSASLVLAINQRPVDLPLVMRVLKETYKSVVSGTDKLVGVVDFTLEPDAYDVNLSPDKRQVLLANETEICEALRLATMEFWSGQFKTNEITSTISTHSKSNAHAPGSDEDDEQEEIGDTSSSSRLFHRRYAFVHDPKTASAKEHDDGKKRIEYESSPERCRNRQRQKTSATSPTSEDASGKLLDEPTNDTTDVTPTNSTKKTTNEQGTRGLAINRVSFGSAMGEAEASDKVTRLSPTIKSQGTAPSDGGDQTGGVLPTDVPDQEGLEHSSSSSREQVPWSERRQWQELQASFNRCDEDTSSAVEPERRLVNGFDRFKAATMTTSTRRKDRPQNPHNMERFRFKRMRSGERVVTSDSRENAAAYKESSSVTQTPSVNRPTRTIQKRERADTRVQESARKDDGVNTRDESTSSTVWTSFGNTEDVMKATLRERIAMQHRKRNLRACVLDQAEISTESGEQGTLRVPNTSSRIRLSKDNFQGMQIVGQFNMGFIVATTPDLQLWILDQHACDEKATFEKLCRETAIQEQPLISPMPLDLSPLDETCILDNMEVFQKNGFRFSYDESKPPRHRLSLVALPHSGAQNGRKAVQYGKEDVIALCAILEGNDNDSDDDPSTPSGGIGTDGTGMYGNNAVRRYASGNRSTSDTAEALIARLPKSIAMFASRACRTSIMIGTALSANEMDKIVKRLSGLAHPWNCPHGRPTLNHVGDLGRILVSDENRSSEHIATPTVTVLSQDLDREHEQD